MIVLLTGTPGSGKSYAAVRTIIDAVEHGKMVATNVPLRADWALVAARANIFSRLLPGRVDARRRRFESLVFVSEELDELLRVRLRGEHEGRGVLVLDEVHRWLNARTWDADESGAKASKDTAVARRLEIVRWFSAHRHYGWDVWLCTQTAENIDRQVRSLFEYVVICRNLKRFKIGGVPISPIHFFLQLWCWNDKSRMIMQRRVYPLRKKLAALYSTHALRHVDAPVDVIWLPREAAPAGPADGRSAPAARLVAADPRELGTPGAGLVNDDDPTLVGPSTGERPPWVV